VLLAYAKMSVFDDLVISNLPDDPYFNRVLKAYFPKVLSEKFVAAIAAHPLKREIVATFMTNTVVNRTGATFVNFIASEAGAQAADVIRAFTLAREIFDLEPLWDQIDALDYRVESRLQLDLLTKLTSIAQRASRWMLRVRTQSTDLPTLIKCYQPAARELRLHLADWLPPTANANWQKAADGLINAGVEPTLAQGLTALEFIFPALDLVDLAQHAGTGLEQAARAYFGVDAELDLTGWRVQINRLPTDTLWQTQARGSARDDVYSIASQITKGLLSRQEDITVWRRHHNVAIDRLCRLLADISSHGVDLAPVSVALRELRHLA
jgi:glutamate dehydrogenase